MLVVMLYTQSIIAEKLVSIINELVLKEDEI